MQDRNLKSIQRKGKILIMDDDKIIRDVTTRLLNKIGYKAESVEEGHAALRSYKRAMASNNPFDAVFIDLNISVGMNGEETIQKLKRLDPEVKAVVFSSDICNPLMLNYRAFGFYDALAKPFSVEELESVLESVKAGVIFSAV